MTKYGNRHVKADGYDFDSKAEYYHYCGLVLEQRAGIISNLELHPRFELQPAFVDTNGKRQRAIVYEADFSFYSERVRVVQDVKGVRTKEFLLKWKLLLYKYSNDNSVRFELVDVKR